MTPNDLSLLNYWRTKMGIWHRLAHWFGLNTGTVIDTENGRYFQCAKCGQREFVSWKW